MIIFTDQILLLTLLSDSKIAKSERARMYLEVVGNSLVTERTDAWVRKTSARLYEAMRKREEKQIFQSYWDLSLLKDRELDVMENVFSQWKAGTDVSISDLWVERQKKFLGARWEGREGVAEMDFHLQLVERGGANINKKDFLRWRETGLAFRVSEETDLQTNVTLLSGEGSKLGYWGDVMTGPFISYETELKYDWSLQDSNNVNSVEDCSRAIGQLEDIIDSLDSNQALATTKLVPLSVSSSTKLEKTLKPRGRLDSVWVGLSMTHLINETFSRLITDSGQVLLETPLYLLLLTKDLLESFKAKAGEIAKSSGLRCEDLEYDVIRTFCIKLVPDNIDR